MKTCVKCGVREDEHCTFEDDGLVFPEHCVCDRGTWFGATKVKRICDSYDGNGVTYCSNCEHDKGCHG